MAKKNKAMAQDPVAPPAPRDWVNAGEDYEPGDIGVPGLEVADETLLAQVLTDAGAAVDDKKHAKQILETILQSVKIGVNLFRPGIIP